MDQIASKQMCVKHSQKKVKFVQVNQVVNSENSHLFYCTTCINKDLTFKGINYLLISQIIDEADNNIIQKWPPVNDYSILEKLIQFTEQQDTSSSVVNQINQFFTHFKEEFLRKIDLCQKNMMNRALELPLGKQSIISQYQQISQISQLKSLLMVAQTQQSSQNHDHNLRSFISKIETQKEKNSELLSKLLKECDKKEELVDFEYPKLIKDSIFSFIDQIDFFNTSKTKCIITQQNSEAADTLNSNKIMKLISNKSNFCSSDFLSQFQSILERINPLLSLISFENMHQNNKNPLDFSSLSNQRFDLIEDITSHLILLEKDRKHSETIKKTFEYQHLEKIVESNVNFMNNNLKGQLQKYIVDSYPLIKQINFTNAALDNEKFDCFRSLTDIEINDLFNLIQQRKILVGDDEYSQSQTKYVKEQNQNIFRYYENVDEIFRKYPIFDLMKKKQQQPFTVKLTKTNWQNRNNVIVIDQDNQLSLNQNNDWINCVSDLILEKDKKYVFKFSIQNYNGQSFLIGLMQNSQCHSAYGFLNQLTCNFYHENNKIQYNGGYGIDKHVKGDKLRLSQENEIEMRVWLGGKQLEILDYPNYQYKVVIQDQYKNRLVEQNDLKLYLAICQSGIKIILKSAEQVDVFPN